MPEKPYPSTEELTEITAAARSRNQKLYKAQSDAHKTETLAQDIQHKVDVLQKVAKGTTTGRFSNVDEVNARVVEYLTACETTGTYPSMMSLAAAFGVSRRWLEKRIAEYDDPVADYLEIVRDQIGDIIINASLYNNANAPMAIFQLKNHHQHADAIQVQPIAPPEPLGVGKSREDIIASLPQIDMDADD